LSDHPIVKLAIGELAAHELISFPRVLNLQIVIAQFFLGNRDANIRRGDLSVDLLELFVSQTLLEFPIVEATLVTTHRAGHRTDGVQDSNNFTDGIAEARYRSFEVVATRC